jgi:hypothetical protein
LPLGSALPPLPGGPLPGGGAAPPPPPGRVMAEVPGRSWGRRPG